jgi:hypothetical protein
VLEKYLIRPEDAASASASKTERILLKLNSFFNLLNLFVSSFYSSFVPLLKDLIQF